MSDTNTLKGLPASPGKVRGRVIIVKNPLNTRIVNNLEEEKYVLVTPFTTPLMTILMFKASAIVTEIGGITSHAATIAREIGIPCVVGVANVTSILKNGEEVEVDGDRGIIRRLSFR